MSQVIYDELCQFYYFLCPHCSNICVVKKEDIRCGIFRHAVFKKDLTFANPHTSKEECERWVKEDLIHGCGKPFKFDGKKVEVCGYI